MRSGKMFVLSEETPFKVLPKRFFDFALKQGRVKWQMVAHFTPQRMALMVKCGVRVVFKRIGIEEGDYLYIVYGARLKNTDSDGLDVVVRFKSKWSPAKEVFKSHLTDDSEDRAWISQSIPLDRYSGQKGDFEIECSPGAEKNTAVDWLAVAEFIVCTPQKHSLCRARMHVERRKKNEIAVFSNVYKMPMFAKQSMNAYTLAEPMVQNAVFDSPIQFGLRLHEMVRQRELSILSLCCGAARVECELLKGIQGKVQLSLLDINQNLLDVASQNFRDFEEVNTVSICADVNQVELPRKKYDVVMCISALHHIVELEHVLDTIADSLTEGGEFWSIAEYVGRNGARLWPESYRIADEIFTQLPEKYRVNHIQYGKPRVDEHLSNMDCSLDSFEGVRSEDIELVLSNRFSEFHVDRWSTIIWRVLAPAYVPNYDVDKPEDRKIVENIVRQDVELHKKGILRPVGMQGIFKLSRDMFYG
jgi:SAM-dependent methyltransferase